MLVPIQSTGDQVAARVQLDAVATDQSIVNPLIVLRTRRPTVRPLAPLAGAAAVQLDERRTGVAGLRRGVDVERLE